eukprot:6047217-Pleurochrysis_carterae.AAC.3
MQGCCAPCGATASASSDGRIWPCLRLKHVAHRSSGRPRRAFVPRAQSATQPCHLQRCECRRAARTRAEPRRSRHYMCGMVPCKRNGRYLVDTAGK